MSKHAKLPKLSYVIMNILVTGGAGFIGSHFIRHLLKNYPSYQITNLDKLTYAGNKVNCQDYADHERYAFVKGDIADRQLVDVLTRAADAIINFAAETHVDRSIKDASDFLQTNVQGTHVLLEAAKEHGTKKYIQISTDEVYGDIDEGSFTEESPLKPSSPYSASKAAGDMLCLSYFRTHGVPVMISRCSNNYGSHQYPEKLIPFFIQKLIKGEKVPVYGDGRNVRDWLHVADHCKAIDLILHEGKVGNVYNVGAQNEQNNLEVTKRLLRALNLPEDRIEFVEDRLGHDVRYSIDASKIQKELDWQPTVDFEEGFGETVEWYKQNFQ